VISQFRHAIFLCRDLLAYKKTQCYSPQVMPAASRTQTLDPQLFRDAFDASPIGIVVENLDGQPLHEELVQGIRRRTPNGD
jgi:hypothetical protein